MDYKYDFKFAHRKAPVNHCAWIQNVLVHISYLRNKQNYFFPQISLGSAKHKNLKNHLVLPT